MSIFSRRVHAIARRVFESLSPGIRTHLPVKITSYDGATNTCKAQPTIRALRTEDPDNKTAVDLPELSDAPVVQFGSGKLLLSCAPAVDSYGVAHVSDRDIEEWIGNGGINNLKGLRTHDLSDSFIHHGAYTLKEDGDNGLIAEPIRTDRIELRTRSGLTNISVLDDETISITNEKCAITIDVDSNILVDTEGTVDVDAEGAVTITSADKVTTSGTETVLQDGTDWAVQFTAMKSAFDTLKNELNALVTAYNAHVHITTATVGATPTPGVIAPTLSVGTPPAAAMDSAKVTDVRLP